MEENSYIFGRNAVLEAIAAGRSIEKIFVSYGTEGESIARIYSSAKKNKIACANYDKRKFIALERSVFPPGTKTQGVIALLRDFDLLTIDELIDSAFAAAKLPIVVALDEISDPQNLGAIARSAECAGAQGIVITAKNSSPITPVAVKISAGALGRIPIAKVSSLTQAFTKMKDAGFWVVGTEMEAEKNFTDNVYDTPVVIVIGSEGEGMRQSTRKHCDFTVKIPMKGTLNSLNASVTAGIMLFEALRQRG